ncbi:MAG: hypothetical protein HYY46_12685 [Deltaproteobacteria bacterium]|nr:hypothetical protein [Deltaproteobacteria bacterium]
MKYWVAVGTPENWKTAFDLGSTWGLKDKGHQAARWKEVQIGDGLIFYAVSPVKGIIGYGVRPQLFWLSLVSSPKELRRLEEANIGKYWQTVRDSEPLDLKFDHPELSSTLARLRQTRPEKGPYGGPGWANYVAAYFNDCYRFCRVLKRALVRRGVAVIVIGNSIIQGHEIKTDLVLADVARQNGFALVGVQQIRRKRVGASITTSAVRQGERNRATLYESAVILRKK